MRTLIRLCLLALPVVAVAQPNQVASDTQRESVIRRYEALKQSGANWDERVHSVRPHVGASLLPRAAALIETPLEQVGGDRSAAEKLEKTQTWWLNSNGFAYMALRNETDKPLASLIFEVSDGLCTAKGRSFYFTVKPEDGKPIAQNEFVVLSFKMPPRFSSGRRCLDIYSTNDFDIAAYSPSRQAALSTALNNLARCGGNVAWHNCIGEYSWNYGKFVGEYKNGVAEGLGVQYDVSGRISKSGTWSKGQLVSSHSVDLSTLGGADVASALTRPSIAPISATSVPKPAVSAPAIAQPNLPKCSSTGTLHNCWGPSSLPGGSIYVGEWRDGQRHGEGIEYMPNGVVASSGRWHVGSIVDVYNVAPNRFPFSPPATASLPQANSVATQIDLNKAERDRLAAEVEAARKRQQELEEQLAKERERAAAAQAQPPSQPVPQGAPIRSAHALVIGNAAYPGSFRLDNPVNDANAISQKLRSMGFTVTMVNDVNRQRLVQAMTQFRRTAASADLTLLFYSGHGVQILGQTYILPTDIDQSDVAQATIQGVSLNNVVESFLPGKTKLVFLDACRDNPLQRTGEKSVSKGLAPISVAQGTLIAYATKDGQTASDGPGQKNSPFTQALLQHLSDPSDIGVVLRRVREKVMQATGGKQQPWDYGSLTGGELILARLRP